MMTSSQSNFSPLTSINPTQIRISSSVFELTVSQMDANRPKASDGVRVPT
jgi:hypothetical protein